jgi:hypothetical protein
MSFTPLKGIIKLKKRGGENMKKNRVLVDYQKYKSQLGTIDTAMREMYNTPESFELFINRMFDLGIIKRIKISKAEVKKLQEQACMLAWLDEMEGEE